MCDTLKLSNTIKQDFKNDVTAASFTNVLTTFICLQHPTDKLTAKEFQWNARMTWQSSRGIVKSLSNICIQSNIPMTKPAKMPTAHWIIFAAGRAIATWNVFWRQKCCHTFITEAFCKMTHYYPNIQKLHAHTRSLGNDMGHVIEVCGTESYTTLILYK